MSGAEKENAPSREAGGAQEHSHKNIIDGDSLTPDATPGDQKGLLSGDTAAAVDFLAHWCPDGPWVLTSIVPDGGRTTTRTFGPGDVAAMAEWVEERQGRQNIYFTVNRTFGPVSSKPSKAEMAAAVALHVDVDPRAGMEVEPERQRIERMVEDWEQDGSKLPFPRPSVVVDSGGGYQCFWLLDAPVEDHPEVEARNIAIGVAMGADACHNIDRLMRLPGTVNLPNKKKREKGRKPALARVVSADWTRRYGLDAFPAAPMPDAPAVASAAPARGVEVEGLPLSDLCKSVIVNGQDPDDANRWGGDRSKAVWWVACEMARAGCSDAVMLGVLLDPDLGISAHVRDQKGAERYARKQVQDAREEVDNNFDCDKEGNPLSSSQRNVRVALRRLGVNLRHDLLAERALVEGLDGFGPNLDDDACNRLWLSIDERFRFRPTVDFFNRVLSDHARQRAFHPVLDYLAALRWDGVPRIGGWLASYGGAVDTPYTRAVGELLLVAAVRRVRRPGVKFDEMLVLESPQGTNKSTALKVLAVRDEWFTDDVPLNAEAKRVIEALAGKWIVEAGELKGMKKGGADHLKGFLSRTHDKARMAYDRREREVPRQCVIVGTTNDSRYLRDTTGNRRFWPVSVEGFDLDALRRDRDQLWAEAAAREAEGAPIRLDPDLWAEAAEEQDARRVEEPFYEALHSALGEERPGKVRGEDVWRIVGRLRGMRTQDDNERLGDAMRRLAFDRTKRRFGLPHPEWCYVRGEGNVPRLVPRFGPDGELEGVAETDGGPGEPF
ncbi:VapE domain-containing protein [Roseicitreum antarcticum]|uniref:Virulence-associated protein E n=1 Tax=Roseicitreum antarcticum TaxID=564137 RepID=A0A1H2U6P9_9RHOB|nr:VapE domain-containing protein [Roseicitreum antarcticum]SDW51836.1 Virulence-associated protein E [Roseicitreum antarcticum]